MKTFKDAIVWQKGYKLTLHIYECTKVFPKSEEFALKSQLRRAAVSVISNVAEGFKRRGNKEKLFFYRVSESSLEETKCQMLLAKDLSYIEDGEYERFVELANEVGRLLSSWIKSKDIGFRP